MKTRANKTVAMASVLVLAPAFALPVMAQDAMHSMDMPPMQGMPMPALKPAPKKPGHATTKPHASTTPAQASSSGTSMPSMTGMGMSSMPGMPMPPPSTTPAAQPEPASSSSSNQSMQGMDMSSMQGGDAPPDARSPDYSDGYSYGAMTGMEMSDKASTGMVMLDQLEWMHSSDDGNMAFVEGQAWYGKDFDKLWLKFEGDVDGGSLQELRTEALWSHAVAAHWDMQLGVRHDFGEGPDRSWATFGVQGLAPYWFQTEATFYLGADGRTAARVQVEYEELLTQRLVLQPKLELNLYGKDDPQRGIGSGLSDAEIGLRLRYEIRREFAPYLGVVWQQRFGRTADFVRAQGESAGGLEFVAGLRLWF